MSIIRTDKEVYLPSLVAATMEFLAKTPFDDRNQICLTSRPGSADPLYEGIGKVTNLDDEREFTAFNDVFKGTYFEKLYNEMIEWSPHGIGRVRLLRLRGRTTYSLHRDGDTRYHVVIQTSTGAFHWTYGEKPFHIPLDGYVWEIDASRLHTAMNTTLTDRVHLVFCTYKRADK